MIGGVDAYADRVMAGLPPLEEHPRKPPDRPDLPGVTVTIDWTHRSPALPDGSGGAAVKR